MFDRDTIRKEVKAYQQEQLGVRPTEVVVERFEAYGQCRDSRRITGLEKQLNEAKEIIKTFCGLCDVFNSSNGSFDNLIAKAETFLKETENA